MSIRCGHCRRSHATVDEVRVCAGLLVTAEEAREVLGKDPVQEIRIVRTADLPQPPKPDITEGMWKLGDRIIKIQRAYHGSGNLYGKELLLEPDGMSRVPEHRWEVIKGAVRMLRENGGRKMTLEEAKQFGALYGFCCSCGRILTNETSIEAGIGPVCAEKFAA